MATYEALRDRALGRCGLTGQTEAQAVAQQALAEAMKFVALKVRIPSLIASATATAPADAELEANAITLSVGGFNVTSTFKSIDRLFVKEASSTVGYGLPYEYLEYHYFIDLKSVASGYRTSLNEGSFDERPARCWTMTPDGKIWAEPLAENNVLTLFFRKESADYSGMASPEILSQFDYILVEGAEAVLKEWEREPEQITTWHQLFEAKLSGHIQDYDRFLKGTRSRAGYKVHKNYRIYC